MSSLSALKILELQIIEKPVCVIEETNSKKKKKNPFCSYQAILIPL